MTFDRLARNPRINFGRVSLRGTRVSVEAITGCFIGGDPPHVIASEYGCEVADVLAALRFVLVVNGCSLGSQRAHERIARVIPQETP